MPVFLIMFITLNPSIITVPPEYLITHHYFLGCIKYIFSIALTLRENNIINIKKMVKLGIIIIAIENVSKNVF